MDVVKNGREQIHVKEDRSEQVRRIEHDNTNKDLVELVIDYSYDGIFVADAQGNGIIVNDAYTRITGVPKQDLLGKNMLDVVNEGIVSESVTLKVLKEGQSKTIVQDVKGKEVLVTGNPVFDDRGEIMYVVTNVRDITELNRLKVELKHMKALSEKYLDELNEYKKKESIQSLMDGVVVHSKEIIKAVTLARKVAAVDSTVILLGESGVGKEVFANLIHTASKRNEQPYIKINCGAIPAQLLESELFGYEKGAFTGADSRGKPGVFEQADGGTIFLDEIGDMPIELQVKLLRVLQEYEITRIGGTKTKKINVRVITATNKVLEDMVENGQFRKDLYYRLHIVPIKIPPLRERKTDIAPLAYYFLQVSNKKYGFTKTLQTDLIRLFEQYDWPGNIREMCNLIERLVVTVDYDDIGRGDLPFYLCDSTALPPEQSLKALVQRVEKDVIRERISEYQTTRKTAQSLGISQSTLVKKMKRLGM